MKAKDLNKFEGFSLLISVLTWLPLTDEQMHLILNLKDIQKRLLNLL